MKKVLTFALLLVVICVAAPARAADRPIQIGIVNPLQLFNEQSSITGLRLTFIYSKNANMTGLDWGGIVTRTTGNMQGIQFGFLNMVDGDATGIQWSAVNWDKTNFTGVQLGAVNVTTGTFTGLQWGSYYNQANHAGGLQVALVNNTTTMKGIQLGLVNIIHKGGWLPVFPIINGSL